MMSAWAVYWLGYGISTAISYHDPHHWFSVLMVTACFSMAGISQAKFNRKHKS